MSSPLGEALIALGVGFDLVGCLGLLRLPDVYTRMQAATKCVALGTLLIVAGAVVTVGGASVLAKGVLCLAFLLLTSPTGSHALARAAHRSGTRLWEGSLSDQLAADRESRP
ncbi:MAG: monovalent cation/H(+) antiporter subunit G [Myxococcota bacterium]|nr:monovalent cation/H(+) antiporter subunit G [Myxococcota bacterium]